MKKLLVGAVALAALFTATGTALAEDIKVALLRLSSSGPLFIAKEEGHFQKQGLNVEFIFVDAASKAPVAVVSGDAAFAVTGATAGFYNLAGKGALKIMGAQSREEPGYDLVAYMASSKAYDAGFKTLKDMPGKTMGITTVGSTFHYAILALAKKLGFDAKSVKMVPLQGLGQMSTALAGGSVDGILTVNSIARKLEKEGAGKILGWVGDQTPWQLGVLVASTKVLNEKPDLVKKFVAAYQAGATDFHQAFLAKKGEKGENYDRMLDHLAKYIQQDKAVIAAGLPFVDPKGRLDVGSIYDQVETWKAEKLVDDSVDPKAIVDLSYIDGHFNQPK